MFYKQDFKECMDTFDKVLSNLKLKEYNISKEQEDGINEVREETKRVMEDENISSKELEEIYIQIYKKLNAIFGELDFDDYVYSQFIFLMGSVNTLFTLEIICRKRNENENKTLKDRVKSVIRTVAYLTKKEEKK